MWVVLAASFRRLTALRLSPALRSHRKHIPVQPSPSSSRGTKWILGTLEKDLKELVITQLSGPCWCQRRVPCSPSSLFPVVNQGRREMRRGPRRQSGSAPSHLRGSAPELCTTRVMRPVCANTCLSSDVTCSVRSHACGQCEVKAFLGFVLCVQRPSSLTIPLSGDEGEALSSGRCGGIVSFLDHTSENSSEGASPQQMGPCDHLAGLEEGSFQKWEEPVQHSRA